MGHPLWTLYMALSGATIMRAALWMSGALCDNGAWIWVPFADIAATAVLAVWLCVRWLRSSGAAHA